MNGEPCASVHALVVLTAVSAQGCRSLRFSINFLWKVKRQIMEFGRSLVQEPSITSVSKIRLIKHEENECESTDEMLDSMALDAANQAAIELLFGKLDKNLIEPAMVDAKLFTERTLPKQSAIQPGDLVVIMQSFDNLNFVYAERGAIYSNRNGHFHHDDFIGKPFGCKVRSRNNNGYGFCHLLKPTPELWTRSLNHRTQIIHELDQSQIVFQLYLRPNMIVVESGTGSGAMSHALLRSVAPHGHLYTYEFNEVRSIKARDEFEKHGLGHLVTVRHKDVCGKLGDEGDGGFDLPAQSVDAVFLDLPEPWLAVPHAAFILKPSARIATYSPCVEQTQRTIESLNTSGFHTITTMEYRLQEYHVDEVTYDPPTTSKRPRMTVHDTSVYQEIAASVEEERQQEQDEDNQGENQQEQETNGASAHTNASTGPNDNSTEQNGKRKKTFVVARPFVSMRGHTAFLTFATAGTVFQPDPKS